MKNETTATFAALILVASMVLLTFGIWYGIVWVICWGFSIAFSVKYVFGAWAVSVLLKIVFK